MAQVPGAEAVGQVCCTLSAAMAFTCKSCGRELEATPVPGTPCPTCGVELVPEVPLEVDPAWEAERAAKVAEAAVPPKPASKAGTILILLVLLAAFATVGVLVFQRQPTAKGISEPTGAQITVTAPK